MKARQLPSGNFNVVVSYYDDFDKRKQKSFTAATEAKALKKAQDYLDGINTVYDDTTTLEKAMKYYIENKTGIIQPTTIRTYRILAENAFTCLHKTRLCDLRAVEIQRAISIESKRASPKYVKNAYGLFKSVLKMFEVDVNLSSVKLPRVVKKEKELPDFATMFDIFHGDEIELFVLLAAWLSLRIGEIAGLQFRDVDEKQKLLHIRRTVIPTEDGNKLREGCKTEKSARTLQLPDYILELIKAIPHENDTDPILQITSRALYGRFKRRVKRYGIEMTFHDLRHLNASIMLMLGIPDKYAMERGGWATDNILKSVYQQTFSAERVKVDAKIDSYFNSIINHQSVERLKENC